MSYTYKFKQSYTKLGLAIAPSSAPVCTVVDTSNNILANAQPTTSLSNMVGVYLYEYTSTTAIDPIAMFYTSDATVDCQTLFDYTPSFLVNNLDVAVSTIKTKTDNLPTNPAAYEDVAASQIAVISALPVAPDNTSITAIKLKTDNLPSNPASQTNLDVAVSSRSSHSASDVWNVTVRTLTSTGGATAQDIWEYDRRTLTSLSIPSNYNSALNGSYSSIEQVPGKLDITMKRSDDLSFDCKFNFDMTGFTYGASITPMTTSGSTDIAIVVTPNDITTGDFHFFISKTLIATLPILTEKHKWNFYWIDGGLKRTTMGGYLNLVGV
jgi:hypothetical protein